MQIERIDETVDEATEFTSYTSAYRKVTMPDGRHVFVEARAPGIDPDAENAVEQVLARLEKRES